MISASLALRKSDRSEERYRFFASCWVMVLPPAFEFTDLQIVQRGILDALPIEAFVREKRGILRGHHRPLE